MPIFGSRAQEPTILTPADAHAAEDRGNIWLKDIRRLDALAATRIGKFAFPLDLSADDFIANVVAARRGGTRISVAACTELTNSYLLPLNVRKTP